MDEPNTVRWIWELCLGLGLFAGGLGSYHGVRVVRRRNGGNSSAGNPGGSAAVVAAIQQLGRDLKASLHREGDQTRTALGELGRAASDSHKDQLTALATLLARTEYHPRGDRDRGGG